MNRDDIIRMAREAGFHPHHNPDLYDCMVASDKSIERFFHMAQTAEREACAKVCIEQSARWYTDQRDVYVAHECAAAIRARGQA